MLAVNGVEYWLLRGENMLDIQFIRDNVDEVRRSVLLKKKDVSLVDEVLRLDEEYRAALHKTEQLRAERNQLTKDDRTRGVEIKKELKVIEPEMKELRNQLQSVLYQIPNIISPDTPEGKDEDENVIAKTVGKPIDFDFEPKEHWELGQALDVIDLERAAKVSGARFNYLKNEVALMQFGLIQLVFRTLTNQQILESIIKESSLNISAKPYIPIVPPVMINPEPFEKMARLDPREERYHIPSDDVYLVGSAEHTLGAMHMDETFDEADLPLRYIGYSTAFRREAGSYGRDTKGILRVHQFDKLEMETFSVKEDSVEEQNLNVAIQEYLLQQLGLPYQVISICTGDIGGPDYRQVDINTWMPGQNKYRETHTADLMTDYQARRLNIKVRRVDNSTEYVHMNDATAIAIGRTIIAIMENYQQSDGSIIVPEVLREYVGKSKIG